MSSTLNTQGIQDLLALPVRAPGGKTKLLIAAALGLASFIIPFIPSIFLLGYGGFIMRRIIREKAAEPALPEWNNWSDMFVLGLKLFGATFIYSLPLFAVMGFAMAAMYVPMFWVMFNAESATRSEVTRLIGAQFAGMFGGLAAMGVGYLLVFVLLLILPAIMGHVVAQDSFGAAFRVREWWRILRANFGGFIVALVVAGGIFTGYMLVGQALYLTFVFCILLPVLGTLVGAYLMIIGNVLFAQAYVEGVERLASASGNSSAPAAPLPAA